MRFMPASDSALLVELDDLAQAMGLYRELRAHPIPGVTELVPAARTVLVHYLPTALSPTSLVAEIRAHAASASQRLLDPDAPARMVEVPVHYNGEDLPEVAEFLGVSVKEVIERHTGQPYLAAFAGFAPGFVYLAGGHPSFQIPRRKSPRTQVPAGSVAVAGDFSAIYPSNSPGGWQLLGVTEIPMWDLNRPEPAYIQPGFRVQFRDASTITVSMGSQRAAQPVASDSPQPVAVQVPASEPGDTASSQGASEESTATTQVEVVRSGIQTLFQDAGRGGMAGLGISPAGALDLLAFRQANRLVGNPPDMAVLENAMGGLQLRAHGRCVLAVTGADAPLSLRNADGQEWSVASHQAIALDEGDLLRIGPVVRGARCYVAVRGGWHVAPVLGSCATDTLARIGPPALQAGMRLGVGAMVPKGQLRAVELAEPATRRTLPSPGDLVVLDVVAGPRDDWFTAEALQHFVSQEWRVTPQSNRIGMRLEGNVPLSRIRDEELPSEGTVTGAIQVPMSGQPVLFLADHPLTGGYPVIAGLASYHLPLAAQIPIGCRIRFNLLASPLMHRPESCFGTPRRF